MPSSPLVSGLLAFVCLGVAWRFVRRLRPGVGDAGGR